MPNRKTFRSLYDESLLPTRGSKRILVELHEFSRIILVSREHRGAEVSGVMFSLLKPWGLELACSILTYSSIA